MKDRVCVGAVLIRAVDHGRDESAPVLLGRRAANREFYPDVWDVLGGHLEPGETSEQALAPILPGDPVQGGWRIGPLRPVGRRERVPSDGWRRSDALVGAFFAALVPRKSWMRRSRT
jgi:hypothetical protein